MVASTRSRFIALIVLATLVAGMVPIVVTPAVATTAVPMAPTAKVIAGPWSSVVEGQRADEIIIREDADNFAEWGTNDLPVRVSLPPKVWFDTTPTVSINGMTLATSQIDMPDKTYIQFIMSGDAATRDRIDIRSIILNVGSTGGMYITPTITGLPDTFTAPNIAKIVQGLIAYEPADLTTVNPGQNNQSLNRYFAFQLQESTYTTMHSGDYITVTTPPGVSFSQPPTATVTGFSLYSDVATLTTDGIQATWQIKEASTDVAGWMGVGSVINVGSGVATDTDIKFTLESSNAEHPVSPVTVRVAHTFAPDALIFETAVPPTIADSVNQPAADITISEARANTLAEDTLAIELVGGTFSSTPIATPSGIGLYLRNADGGPSMTGVPGIVDSSMRKASWRISDHSIVAGKITISDLSIDATGLDDGPVKVKVYGGAVGIPLASNAKLLTIAKVAPPGGVRVRALAQPTLVKNGANQHPGNITITESIPFILYNQVQLEIFGNTSDHGVLFSETPTVNVTSGDLAIGSIVCPVNGDHSKTLINLTNISKVASTITISDIKYDINSKAQNGPIQVIVSNEACSIGTVSTATVGTPILNRIEVTPNPTTLAVGATWQFTARGFDFYGNELVCVPTWTVTGGIGTVTSAGLFAAGSAGTGTVRASVGDIVGEAAVTVSQPANSGGGGGTGGGGGGGSGDKLAPAAPQSLRATPSVKQINLIWNPNKESDLAGYSIYRTVKGSTAFAKLNPSPVLSVEYHDTTAEVGKGYTYYVTAVDSSGNESLRSNEATAARIAVKGARVYHDVPSQAWFADAVSLLSSADILTGYGDGSFKPAANVTRAEFAKMLCTAMGWELAAPSTPSFSDVPSRHWAFSYVETAKKHGILDGYSDGAFRPGNNVTRAEIAKMIASALSLEAGDAQFADTNASWARDFISACAKAGLISGYLDGTFKPSATATRAEAAKVIALLLNR